jgi:hypothetical protein
MICEKPSKISRRFSQIGTQISLINFENFVKPFVNFVRKITDCYITQP